MFQSYANFLQRAFSLSLISGMLLSLNACQNSTVGQLRFQVAIANNASFAIQAIPSQTDSLRIEITGEGLTAPMIHTLSISKGQTTYSHQFSLPVGEKEVKVTAREGDKILAEGNGSANVSANQSTPLKLVLKPIETEVKGPLLTVEGIIPVEIPLNIKITGVGISEPLTPKATLPAGVNSSVQIAETKLPLGEKTLELRFTTPNSNLGDQLPTIVQTFTVSDTKNTQIVLNLEALLLRYREQIKGIPAFLNLLRQYAPQLLPLLGPLPETSPTPATPASTRPSPTANAGGGSQIQIGELISASPTPSPTPEAGFLADVRLAYQQPASDSTPFASGTSQNFLALTDQSAHTLSQNQIWGILVRSQQLFETDANPPEYVLQIKKASGEAVSPLIRGTLNRRVSTASGIYRGGFAPFTASAERLSLEANSTYTVDWVVFSPGTNRDIRARYILKTP